MRWWPTALAVAVVLPLSACADAAAPEVAGPAVRATGTAHGSPGTATGTAYGSPGTATGTAHGSPGTATGTVYGTFELEGGPIGPDGSQPSARPLSGVVTFQGQGAGVTVRVGKAGRFSVRLPAGTYTVSGRASSVREQLPGSRVTDPPCSSPLTTTVRAGTIDQVTVACIVP